jgi:hypothetical protein
MDRNPSQFGQLVVTYFSLLSQNYFGETRENDPITAG